MVRSDPGVSSPAGPDQNIPEEKPLTGRTRRAFSACTSVARMSPAVIRGWSIVEKTDAPSHITKRS